MKIKDVIFVLSLYMMTIIGLNSCTSDTEYDSQSGSSEEVKTPVQNVSLDVEQIDVTLGSGEETKKLSVSFLPEDADVKDLMWTSSDPAIVLVDQEGNITANNDGEAIIYVRSRTNPKIFAACNIIVSHVKSTGVTLNMDNLELKENGSFKLIATVYPSEAYFKNVEWNSTDENIVTVDKGNVIALRTGSAVVRATTKDGFYAECTVNVSPSTDAGYMPYPSKEEFDK